MTNGREGESIVKIKPVSMVILLLWSVASMGGDTIPVVRMSSEAALAGTSVGAGAQGGLLTGQWRVNQKMSDEPKELVKERLKDSRSNSHVVSDPHGRNDGHGTLGSLPRYRSTALRRLSQEFSIPELPQNLSLKYAPPALMVAGDDGHTRTWYTDNRGVSVSAMGGVDQETVTAGWEGNVLVVERISPLGPGSVERYQVNSKTGQLDVGVVLTVPGAKGAIEYQMVYDRIIPAPASDGG